VQAEVSTITSLSRLGDRRSLQRALDILQRLDRQQKLTAKQRGWIPALEATINTEG
jgi:hypothetical protein